MKKLVFVLGCSTALAVVWALSERKDKNSILKALVDPLSSAKGLHRREWRDH